MIVTMNVSARHLPEPWCLLPWCRIDSFFRIFRQRESEELKVWESEVVLNNQNPDFKPVVIAERKLCRKNQ
jgi:hypothetical protein